MTTDLPALPEPTLLPCPFCGAGTTNVHPNGQMWLGSKMSEPVSVSIRHWCTDMPGQPSRMIERVGRDEASAIAAWNARAALAAQQPAAVPAGWVDEIRRLRTALRFYANGEHFNLDESEEFDTVSGEPQNWLCSGREDSSTMVENGRVALLALQGEDARWVDGDEDCTPQPVAHEVSVLAAAPAVQPTWSALNKPEIAAAAKEQPAEAVAQHEVMRHVRRLQRHIEEWCEWYGATDVLLRNQLPLPPAGTVRIMEDFNDAIKRAEPKAEPVAPSVRAALSESEIIGYWGDRSDGPSTAEIIGFARLIERAALAAPAPAAPLTEEQVDGIRGLDTTKRVRFYEHDFYVLSNFSAFSLQWKGRRFDTSEAAYHYEKFPDRHDIGAAIIYAPSAHEAFKVAEANKALRRPDWDSVKVDIMRDILRAKAQQHEYVRRKLLATGDRELVEDSWRDDFWGWGPNRDGQNMLGRLWMEVRSELRAHGIAQPGERQMVSPALGAEMKGEKP